MVSLSAVFIHFFLFIFILAWYIGELSSMWSTCTWIYLVESLTSCLGCLVKDETIYLIKDFAVIQMYFYELIFISGIG